MSGQVAGRLSGQKPRVVFDIEANLDSGIYAWWVRRSHLKDADPPIPAGHANTADPRFRLLYVGISPRNERSRRTLSVRLASDHHGGNIGSSTFRFTLAALIHAYIGLEPLPGYDRARVVPESSLTEWIDSYCGVTIAVRPSPWEVEDAVIRILDPPLNLRPGYHPYRETVKVKRRALERACGLRRKAATPTWREEVNDL